MHDVANLAFEELVSLFADELLKGQDGSDRPALELATALTSGAFSVGAETLVLGSQPVAVDGVADRLYRGRVLLVRISASTSIREDAVVISTGCPVVRSYQESEGHAIGSDS